MNWSMVLAALLFLIESDLFVAGKFLDDTSSSDSSEQDERRHEHHYNYHHDDEGRGQGKQRPKFPISADQPAPRSNRPTCDQDWFTLYRPQGIWCLRVGIGKMDYNGAIAQCATYGGILSGIQNADERMLIANEANRQTLAYNIQSSGVWLGAQKNSDTNTFDWNDGHTTGTAGFHWGPNEPDSDDTYGPKNCIQLLALAPGYWDNAGGAFENFKNGDLDDYWCNRNDNPVTRMYACGKPGPHM